MKKTVSVLLSVSLLLTLFTGMAIPASANADFLYTVDVSGATVTDYVGNDTDLTVPDMLGGKRVIAIGASAFENHSALVRVTLPDSVKRIDEAAFMHCSSLTEIHVGNVREIGFSAFYGCDALKTVSYTGNEAGWNAVSVAAFNEPLTTATVTYSSGIGSISLLPENASDFRTLSEGDGTIEIRKQTQGYRFEGTGGWPSAYTAHAEDEYVSVDVFSDTYLNFDFTVSGGATNIILAFGGMDIVSMRTEGHYVTLNRLIDPLYVDEEGIIYDVWNGTYTASVHVGALGCDPSLVTNGIFTISDIKIYSVEGATVDVRDLSLGVAKYDVLNIAQTSYKAKSSQSLLPTTANAFAKGYTNTGVLNITNTPDGFYFRSTNGWPCAFTTHYQTGNGYVLADPDDYLYYDFSVYGLAQTHLAVFFGGTNPLDDSSAGTFASLNPLIHPRYIAANGDIIDFNGGNFKGFIRIGDLGCHPSVMQNGKVPISDIKLFSVNKQQDSAACILLRELAVVKIETYSTTATTSATTTTTTTVTTSATAPAVTFSVSVSQQEAILGDFVDVSVCVSEGHHLVNGQLWVNYDPTVLEPLDPFEVGYITEVNTDIFDSSYLWDANVPTPGCAKFAFVSGKSDGTTAGGSMFTLNFRIIGTPSDGTTAITLSAPETGSAVNGVDYDIHPTFENAVITFPALCGDVNSDGRVNLDDTTAVFYHVNRLRILEGDALLAADVSADGAVNLYDAARLFYYTNGILGTL